MDRQRLSPADYVLATLLGAAILILAAQVFFRYVLNSSLTWPEELARFVFTWIIFLGAALAIRDGLHIRIDLIVERLPRRVGKWLRAFTDGLMLVFLVVMVILGIDLVRQTANTYSTALSLPENYVYYASLPVAFLLAVCYAVRRIVSTLRTETKATPQDTEEA